MTRLRLAFVFVAVLGASGCTHIESSHVLTGPPQQPNAASQITIYMEGQEPPPGYTEIAIVAGRGNARAGARAHAEAGTLCPARAARLKAVVVLFLARAA